MHIEIPECKRCCCCVPLRYGLIVWAYLKFLLTAFEVTETSFRIRRFARLYNEGFLPLHDIVIIGIIMIVITSNLIFGVLFIIGCHKKSIKILNIYYYYAISIIGVSILLNGYVVLGFIIPKLGTSFDDKESFIDMTKDISLIFLNIVLQIYIVFIVRSEIKKLENNYQFTFVNNAVEAECTLDVENEVKVIKEDGQIQE